MSTKDYNNKRCIICDHCQLDDSYPDSTRSFKWDAVEKGWICYECRGEINEILDFWPREEEKELCIYCDDIATDRDHIPPIAYTNLDRKHGFTVPACKECNSVLSDNLFVTLDERISYLAEEVPRRHKRLLHTPEWSKEELDELAPSFRDFIQSELKRAEKVKERVRVLKIKSSMPDKETPVDPLQARLNTYLEVDDES